MKISWEFSFNKSNINRKNFSKKNISPKSSFKCFLIKIFQFTIDFHKKNHIKQKNPRLDNF